MGAILKFLLGLLVPPDPCPWDLLPGASDQQIAEAKRDMRRYLIGISGITSLIVVALVGSVFTSYGFAVAGDVQSNTEKAIAPVSQAVADIKIQLASNESANKQMLAALNELRAASIAVNIDRLVRRRCLEQNLEEVISLRRDIDQQKAVYRALAGLDYTEPSCTEVRR